jgi:hypothetical protein
MRTVIHVGLADESLLIPSCSLATWQKVRFAYHFDFDSSPSSKFVVGLGSSFRQVAFVNSESMAIDDCMGLILRHPPTHK